jgi:hypothetical protein
MVLGSSWCSLDQSLHNFSRIFDYRLLDMAPIILILTLYQQLWVRCVAFFSVALAWIGDG